MYQKLFEGHSPFDKPLLKEYIQDVWFGYQWLRNVYEGQVLFIRVLLLWHFDPILLFRLETDISTFAIGTILL